MLRKYGSSVDESSLDKLVSAFAELRLMADEGLIAYPYSTREVVNIVKHIQVRYAYTQVIVIIWSFCLAIAKILLAAYHVLEKYI